MIICRASGFLEQGGQPERRAGRFHKSKVSGRRPVTLVVRVQNMSATQQRDIVSRLAKCDTTQALKVARAISDPWFRAQSLAHICRYTSDDPCGVAREAERAAQECDDAYKRCAVRAWEISALAEIGKSHDARRSLNAVMKQAESITPASSKSEALILLLHTAARIGIDETSAIAELLIKLVINDPHWRCIRAIKEATAVLAHLDATAATKFAESIKDEKIKLQCLATVPNGGRPARPFFW